MRELTQVAFQRDGDIARLTFQRPESLNALSPTLIDESLHVAEEVAASDARVLIIAGAGKSFSAGVDLKVASMPEHTAEANKRFSEQARQLAMLFETMPQATIARVTGHCFTGGLEIALGCDLIVASEDSLFCDTHGKLGLRPGWGLSQRLPRAIGTMRAREMSFTGRRVGAQEAVDIGLILAARPLADLDAYVDQLAASILASKAASIIAYKGLYRASENMGLDEGLAYEGTAKFARPARREPRVPLSDYLKT
jgi:enoyl-CoA hydratase